MKISRRMALVIHFVFDHCIPPVLRDAKWFMWLPFKLLFGDKAHYFFTFKDTAPSMSHDEFMQAYRDTADVHIDRETDLTPGSLAEVEAHIIGPKVLDIGCGRGFLSKRLAVNHEVTGADILVDDVLKTAYPYISFQDANIEQLPFADNAFDTVVSTHTLEHVQHLSAALTELRRVCAKRLIIVVPKQRPYRYTFDLHLHFFPYRWQVLSAFSDNSKTRKTWECYLAGGDWFYMETASTNDG